MKTTTIILLVLSAGLLTVPALAQDTSWAELGSAPTRAYLNLGTQGVGAGVAKSLNNSVDLRVGISTLSYSRSVTGESLHTDASLKLNNLGLYADYFPFESSGFRLTAGVQAGTNQVNLIGKPSNNTITVNGQNYVVANAGDSVTGKLDMGNTAPYLGLGYSQHGPNKSGLSLNFDLGVRFGKADVSLTRNGFTNLPQAQQAQMDADLKTEQNKLTDDLKVLKTYPVVSLGLSYRW